MKPDIIVSWPRNCDYPLWRQFIHDNRSRFNEIIIVFTETNHGDNFVPFVKEAMVKDYCLFVDISEVPQGEDWRNFAINRALLHSYNAEWIWFTEQDFLPKEGFWEAVVKEVNEQADAIGIYEGERLHPACLFMKRTALQKTSKNFGIVKDKLDHFGMITRDIHVQDIILSTLMPTLWSHMSGLSHNFVQIARGDKPNWKIPEFNEYLATCLKVTVPQNSRFNAIIHAYLASLDTTPPTDSPTAELASKS